MSAAFTLSDGTTHAAAAGVGDRATGETVTTSSQYPGGSCTKTMTAVASLKLAEQGKINLDDPVHKAVDPWLKTQGHKSLLELWGGDQTIQKVTARQLLQMRGGVPDYDDSALRDWTVAHPSKDYLPIDFVENVNKKFLFPPGEGGAYSGVSYVLMGWTLCAATNCTDWTKITQADFIEEQSTFKFNNTRFMMTGPCSQYRSPGLVHQYLYGSYKLQQRAPLLTNPLEAAPPAHCSPYNKGGWYAFTSIEGTLAGKQSVTSGGAAACCAAGDTQQHSAYWTFVQEGTSTESGTCYFWSQVSKGSHQENATSGRADSALSASDFTDLYNASCLNGWTMGNIATTPSELTRFYHAVFAEGGVISADSVAQMQHWEKFTTGFSPGSPYGLGLFEQPLRVPLKAKWPEGCPKEAKEVCKCELFTGCQLEATYIGHPGLDYGSGFPLVGFVKGLNLSFAIGSNTGENPMGMNYTLGTMENGQFISSVFCPFLQSAFQAQVPGFPDFECQHH